MPKRTIRFLLYTIHGHLARGTPDYAKLLRGIVRLKGRFWRDGKRVIAFGTVMIAEAGLNSERVVLTVYSGDADKSVLYFDLNSQAEISSLLETGRFVARKTHVIFDPTQRVVLIEAGRGHPSAEEIAKIIEAESRRDQKYDSLDLSFVPVAAATFGNKIDEMQRIQSVTVSIARPNFDWGDRYDQLTKLADDSRGKAIDTTIRARRNDSLSKQRGLIPSLKHWLSDRYSSVSSAKVKGALSGTSGLIELKLSDHVETVSLTTEASNQTGYPLDSDVQDKLNAYLDQRSERR